jgi:hypothetical protein
MQKVFMLVLIGLSFVFFAGCKEQSNEQKKNDNPSTKLCQVINEVHVNDYMVIYFLKVKEHDYLMVKGNKYTRSAFAGMVHDPDCKKCYKTETK